MKQKFSNIIKGDGKTIIMLYGEVGEGCSVDSSRVVSELFANENQDCKIEVRINSQGGDVFSGMAIYNNPRATSPYILMEWQRASLQSLPYVESLSL